MITKLFLLSLFVFIAILVLILNNKSVAGSSYTFLALGDSYTVGENVALFENYPYQTVQLMRKAGYNFNAPEIIAQTGWTSNELKQGIRNTYLQPSYHFASLLIGVNDQYRGEDPEAYRTLFEQLLQQAISLTGNRRERVFVLSIPDWGVTPFAEGKDRSRIAEQINRYNRINEEAAQRYGVRYLAITDSTREAGINSKLLASDGLHYSKKEYANWAQLLAEGMMQALT